MDLTPSQEYLLRIADKHRGEWVTLNGICRPGSADGRGLHSALRSLERKGLVETEAIPIRCGWTITRFRRIS